MKTLLGLLTLLLVALLLRSTALSVLAARGVLLDVLAFAVVVWALARGEGWGTSFGFVLGLMADIDAAHWLGRHALVLALLGYAVGRLSHTLVRDSFRTQLALLFIATMIHETWVLSFDVGSAGSWPWLLGRVALAALVTAPTGALVLLIARLGSGQPLFGHADLQSGSAL
jgi:rod shape-determining protein MreD